LKPLVSELAGYHYFVELMLDPNMVKTAGEIFVAIYSNYEMLGNLSMTHKWGWTKRFEELELILERMSISSRAMFFEVSSVSMRIWAEWIMPSCISTKEEPVRNHSFQCW
jgi:hypothetical protein